MKQDMILILDLGSEENPRLAREIRALGVYSEIHPHDITAEELAALPNVKGIILNGGPNRVVDGVEIDAAKEIYNAPVPVLLADHKGDQPWPEDAAARKEALSNFVFQVCGAQANWNMENFIADQVELIRQQVGDKKVLLALSGGVDSSVVAALLINTPTKGRKQDSDGFKIRRSAVEHSVACVTAIDTARAVLTVREQSRSEDLTPIDITKI